ncbi:hypothetical protein BGY98DRAFT_955005, partial [Russula aff. rugulosa BPL654]
MLHVGWPALLASHSFLLTTNLSDSVWHWQSIDRRIRCPPISDTFAASLPTRTL